jgi:hypothetical protein
MKGGGARAGAALIVLAVTAMMGFSFLSLVMPGTELIPDRPSLLDFVSVSLIVFAFPLVGAAIVTRRSGNPIGWLFLGTGFAMASGTFTTEYADRVVSAGTPLPAADLAAWVNSWSWGIGPMVFIPLAIVLFPDGGFPSRRWRTALLAVLSLPFLAIAGVAFAGGAIIGWERYFQNPFALPGTAGDIARWLGEPGPLSFAAFTAPPVLAVVATAVRMRRSRGAERQQLKWLIYPVGIFVSALAVGIVTEQPLAWSTALVSFAAVPVCAGIAILRYRLYDIDVVIRRTLVYGAVVAVLAVVYVALVLVLQVALSAVTGGETLPVALSTLAIAALFGPVRARVRQLVDRRFYRSRYDAQRTLETFAARLRDEVELEAVGDALVAVADRAVQPATAGVWIRTNAR